MNEQDPIDVESAYGSDTSSNYKLSRKSDDFLMEKNVLRNPVRSRWLICKLREYMVLEAVFFLILVFVLITCYRITSQNQETQKMIIRIQSQLNSLQIPATTGKDDINTKQEHEKEIENKFEETETTLEEVLKEALMKSVVQLEQNQPIVNSTSHSEGTQDPPTVSTVSVNSNLERFNAASLIYGATIDTYLSSRSSLNPLIDSDESDLVLVDRPESPANESWCTSDKSPVLTVVLAKYIKPSVVSYQHSKWNGTIPDDAPKVYSVEACLDNHCMTRKPLFSNCEYNSHGLQEQFCNNVSNDSTNALVGKVQFQFHKNHGNTERTCVSLVRVYSETEVVPEQKFRGLEDTTTCSDLKNSYHNNPKKYKDLIVKNCTFFYSKGCCRECPECCDECEVKTINFGEICLIFVFGLPYFLTFSLVFKAVYLIVLDVCGCSASTTT